VHRYAGPAAIVAVLAALVSAVPAADRVVNFFNWSDYIAEAELKNFEKNTGIKVNYTTYDSNEILDAKLKTGRLAVRCAEEAVQIHGGYGFIEEYPVCRFYRDAKILTIGEGTDEVQQMVIARALGA